MGDGLKRARDAARATRGLPPETPKLAEVAERIAAHLARFEADPVVNAVKGYGGSRLPLYYQSGAYPAGAKVGVVYINFQYHSKLSKRDALGYLAWLDAGGVGRHWEWERQQASKGEGKS